LLFPAQTEAPLGLSGYEETMQLVPNSDLAPAVTANIEVTGTYSAESYSAADLLIVGLGGTGTVSGANAMWLCGSPPMPPTIPGCPTFTLNLTSVDPEPPAMSGGVPFVNTHGTLDYSVPAHALTPGAGTLTAHFAF
jgi:hypothetical protein